MRSIWIAVALAAAMSTAAYAAGEWPEGLNKLWFERLERPDNHLAPERWNDPKSLYCCGIADTVKTKFKVEPGNARDPEDRWYAWLKDEWTLIPPEKIVRLTAKPATRHTSPLPRHQNGELASLQVRNLQPSASNNRLA